MIGCVPAQVPLFAVSVCPACGVPEIVGNVTFAGAEGVAEPAPSTSMSSAASVKAWAAVSLPIWIVWTPAVPRLAVVEA